MEQNRIGQEELKNYIAVVPSKLNYACYLTTK